MIYCEKISTRLAGLRHSAQINGENATGIAVNFACGSYVRYAFSINIDSVITGVKFKSNGCGYMVSTADILAESIVNVRLTDLHGLADADLRDQIESIIGVISPERQGCVDSCVQALHAALAAFRATQIEEFAGEKALVCTCFGVTEERIAAIIRENSIGSVDEVSARCNAGLGCGSCRMMIEEMIDGMNA